MWVPIPAVTPPITSFTRAWHGLSSMYVEGDRYSVSHPTHGADLKIKDEDEWENDCKLERY